MALPFCLEGVQGMLSLAGEVRRGGATPVQEAGKGLAEATGPEPKQANRRERMP